MRLRTNKILATLFALAFLFACKSDDDTLDQNPFLINPLVNISLNLNLPEYNALNFPGGSVTLAPPQGIKGVVIYNINNTEYSAFELSDPNHTPNSCSRMEIEGVFATCTCTTDNNEYNIITGQHTSPDETLYPMLRYNAVRNGNTIQVSN
ncbi:hypothetical protein G5B37_08125 [Rasiella rasia]|uniref:Nitrite reductase/ring-hydroxylating ferredoxin subunit n=1 Tax=Rasiella rasia TaxID=2744027 RepID=A0A6G6GM12_9FLAO|nr:hypothetical protein [Rasiella rasia]QIE59530.1 hypothetical protein G5B37_08125 [Rasiella rasia]